MVIEDWQQHIWILRVILGRIPRFHDIREIVTDMPGDAVFLAHPAHCVPGVTRSRVGVAGLSGMYTKADNGPLKKRCTAEGA